MRFDEASAWYAEFGAFYIGLQFAGARQLRAARGRGPRAWALNGSALHPASERARFRSAALYCGSEPGGAHELRPRRPFLATTPAFHGTPGNKACHYVGIPLIVVSLFAMLSGGAPLHGGRLHVTLAEAALLAATAYYLQARRRRWPC